ncbi:potassium transporter 5-like [Hevea brasiliensis]|uniref:potassium transporter 5-like n=1 Tax=Hevea brasiliensis TaxID=3981 RepID=UPI0025F2981A|nr:potassium transporter 5-like [Hevea brasiliensis]
MPNHQANNRELSNYKLETPNRRMKMASAVNLILENSVLIKFSLLFMSMIRVSMVLSYGILTPCISLLFTVECIKEDDPSLTDNAIMWISVGILISLFQIQRFGIDKVRCVRQPDEVFLGSSKEFSQKNVRPSLVAWWDLFGTKLAFVK